MSRSLRTSLLLVVPLALTACGGGSEDVPDVAYCESVAEWLENSTELEEEVLVEVNERRAAGADCGTQGVFEPAPALSMSPELRCAARKHTRHMADEDYFAHNAPDGTTPADRIAETGYEWSTWGENIAGGRDTAAGVVDQWMDSDGHCANIMNPNFEEIGVGYVPGGQWGHLWTQVFGTPR